MREQIGTSVATALLDAFSTLRFRFSLRFVLFFISFRCAQCRSGGAAKKGVNDKLGFRNNTSLLTLQKATERIRSLSLGTHRSRNS